MRLLLTSTLVFLICVAASPAQPKPVDKKPADKKPADKKPPDKIDRPPMTTSATDVSKIDGETLEQWIAKLSSPDASLRDTALRVIPGFGVPGEKALPKIMSMMVNDADTSVRVTAIRIATMGSTTDVDKLLGTLTPNLNTLMGHTSSVLRLQATLGAGRLGARGAGCIGKLCDVIRVDQSSYEVRRAAASALANVARGDPGTGCPDVRAIHALLGALSDSALAVRADVIQALITLGPPYEPSDLDGVRKSVANRIPRETDAVQKMWLRVLLMRSDWTNTTTIKANMALLVKEMSNPKLRANAAECIGMMGREAKVALAELQSGVNSVDAPENLPFVYMCIWALGQLEGDALPALEDIKKWQNHKDNAIKSAVTEAVKRITALKKN